MRDGLALSLSALIGSLAGFVSWLIAAQIMPQAEVGKASAVVSAFILVAGAAQLNVGVGLMRWLPGSGRHASTLVSRVTAIVLPLCGLLGLGYVLVVPELARTAAGDVSLLVGVVVFVLATAGWGMFVVHDFVLVAIGRSWWAPWRNAAFAVVRVALLLVLGGSLGAQGVVLSWALPITVWILGGGVLVAVFVRRFAREAEAAGALPSRAEVSGFLGPTAVAQLGTVLLYNQVTILVTLRYGPEPGAAFFIAWQAVTVVDTAATFFLNSLSVQIAREPERAAELIAAARRRVLMVFLPMLALGAVLAEPVLGLFGTGFAAASDVLRLLLVGLAFRLVVLHELGVRQALGQALGFARLQLVSTMLVLLAAAVLPVPLGAGVGEVLMPVAIGYLAIQVGCATWTLASPAISRRKRNQDRKPGPVTT